MLLWNQKDLPPPPTNTFKVDKPPLDLHKLRNALSEGLTHFKDNTLLINEAAILARILYRMKTKFRSAKDFKLLEKISRSLKIYFGTNMSYFFSNILDTTPTRYEAETYLPTKNMLNYILVRLQGLAKLMERTYETCFLAASELNERLCIGHFWKQFLILFALVSRLSILIKFNTKCLCELYGKLLPYSKKLENVGKNWLPKEYVLPPDIRTWLGVQWVYEEVFIDLTYEPTKSIIDFFNLADDEDDDVLFCDEYILLGDEDQKIGRDFGKLTPIKEVLTRNRMRGFSINEDDIGEDIADIITLDDSVNLVPIDTQPINNQTVGNEELDDVGEEIDREKPQTLSNKTTSRNPSTNKNLSSVLDNSKTSTNNNSTSGLTSLSRKQKKKNKRKINETILTTKSLIPDRTKTMFDVMNNDDDVSTEVTLKKGLAAKRKFSLVGSENLPGATISDDIIILSDETLLEPIPLISKKKKKKQPNSRQPKSVEKGKLHDKTEFSVVALELNEKTPRKSYKKVVNRGKKLKSTRSMQAKTDEDQEHIPKRKSLSPSDDSSIIFVGRETISSENTPKRKRTDQSPVKRPKKKKIINQVNKSINGSSINSVINVSRKENVSKENIVKKKNKKNKKKFKQSETRDLNALRRESVICIEDSPCPTQAVSRLNELKSLLGGKSNKKKKTVPFATENVKLGMNKGKSKEKSNGNSRKKQFKRKQFRYFKQDFQ